MNGVREVEISASTAWIFYILAVAILHNSKLAAGDPQHSGRRLADNPSGFITLDCGLPEGSSYTDTTSGINYISDATFVDTGISRSISPKIKDAGRYTRYLRSFPEGIRNCYTINNITGGSKYLIRATFFYGNYDGIDKPPEFDLHIGANMWDTVKFDDANISVWKELIHVLPLNYIQVCLVNKSQGTPFISTIELRQLQNTSYTNTSGSLALRYAADVYDRSWSLYKRDSWTELSTNLSIEIPDSSKTYKPPSIVMSTAVTPKDDSAPLEFSWELYDDESEYYMYMYFAEVVRLKTNQSRSFNISFNGELRYGPVAPSYLSANTISINGSPQPIESGKKINGFSIFKTEKSTLPPIINAFEIYSVKYFKQPETHKEDVDSLGHHLKLEVDSITEIKSIYGIKRNWQGDPCGPKAYFWEGLNCSYDDSNPPRIISLNFSSSGLTGEISADISNLVMLQILDLSNNSLTGSVLYSLSQLPHLRVLNLERNQLSGSVPLQLIERSNNGSLLLSILGKGGFGTVYHGYIDDTQVAVKMLSQSSVKGISNISQRHVKLLMRVHHRNLTTLVGYCYEGTNMGLIYEYMAKGDLEAHLSETSNRNGCGTRYYKSNRLTEKTDVYSFGVVLLKIITGRSTIGRMHDMTHISQWVSSMLSNGDIRNIADPRMPGNLDVNSVWKAVEIAMLCVSPTSARRPNMSQGSGGTEGVFGNRNRSN
ncbi:hypothetical protein CJ030_MR3G026353 [Morella rubra]|uniref:non-specific serine/threonine protein kinase n=1 Tax=Morella rubra TaxID=262757 RepID=A0A6A1W0P6_9ROSI|nr:hypothetical protein CJ030_MR3G026353 [Morella rubra]